MRVAVKLAYLGKDFNGSQYQPGLRTVVGDIYRDLSAITNGRESEWFDLMPSGRTDAGVNALGNVVVFNSPCEDPFELLRALNAVSTTIFYRSVAVVDESFYPRFADYRVYRYVMPAKNIDIELAKQCAQLFLGEHDFVRFCKTDDKYTVLTIDSIDVEVNDGYLELTFKAHHFLWNMIRRMSSAISWVGRGKRTLQDVTDALNGKPVNFGVARPDGLTLMDVHYNDIEFKEPPRNRYSHRAEEELFVCKMKKDFFSSL